QARPRRGLQARPLRAARKAALRSRGLSRPAARRSRYGYRADRRQQALRPPAPTRALHIPPWPRPRQVRRSQAASWFGCAWLVPFVKFCSGDEFIGLRAGDKATTVPLVSTAFLRLIAGGFGNGGCSTLFFEIRHEGLQRVDRSDLLG